MNNTDFERIIVIASISLIFALYGVLAIRTSNYIPEVADEHTESYVPNYHLVYLEHTKLKVLMYSIPKEIEYAGQFEEEVSEEMNCLMYATIPIGRYYITAYNHEETGSKKTASGTTCHEGTISTAAGDVWGGYFKFGDYIEVDSRIYKIEDTGSAVRKKHVDLYFSSYKEMARYGSNWQNISRVEFPFGKPKED